MTGIAHEGIALNAVANRQSDWDADSIAVFFADVVAAAGHAVRVLGTGDTFSKSQLALEHQFVLFRRWKSTAYIHVAVVESAASLGVSARAHASFSEEPAPRNLGAT
ncbi:MAG: hypothetical protein R3E66_09920 [bacterium]